MQFHASCCRADTSANAVSTQDVSTASKQKSKGKGGAQSPVANLDDTSSAESIRLIRIEKVSHRMLPHHESQAKQMSMTQSLLIDQGCVAILSPS